MANETKTANINVTPQKIEFVTAFADNFKKFLELHGVTRKIRKPNGTQLSAKHANITLQSGVVAEFADIPYSEANVTETPIGSISFLKYKKGVSLEAIADHGYNDAVRLTDEALRTKLIRNITTAMYTNLKSGELTYTASSFQMALSMANGLVLNAFDAMDKDVTEVVGFANVLDVFEYLGAANITVQTMFGMQYVENFLGYRRLFLNSDGYIPRGTVIATPVNNLIDYYIDAGDAEFGEAGLEYVSDPLAPFVGFQTAGNYDNASSNRYAIIGNALMAEYIDGVAVVTVGKESDTYATITVTSAAGTDAGDSKVKAAKTLIGGEKLYYKDLGAASAPTYLSAFDATGWTAIEANKDVNIEDLTSGHTLTVIGVNGAGQVISKGTATIVVKGS